MTTSVCYDLSIRKPLTSAGRLGLILEEFIIQNLSPLRKNSKANQCQVVFLIFSIFLHSLLHKWSPAYFSSLLHYPAVHSINRLRECRVKSIEEFCPDISTNFEKLKCTTSVINLQFRIFIQFFSKSVCDCLLTGVMIVTRKTRLS